MHNKSARAKYVVDTAQEFFMQYLFVTESNYKEYLKQADLEAKKKSAEFDSVIAKSKVLIANKERVYDETKELILKNPELKEHYSLDKHAKEISKLKADSKRAMKQRDNIQAAIPTFEEYLKLLQSTPVALGKICDMKTMDALLRIFFSNFTIHPAAKGTFKGSTVTYKLNEPWEGFVNANDFVLGAGEETQTLDLFLGKEALYQLSYTRITLPIIRGRPKFFKPIYAVVAYAIPKAPMISAITSNVTNWLPQLRTIAFLRRCSNKLPDKIAGVLLPSHSQNAVDSASCMKLLPKNLWLRNVTCAKTYAVRSEATNTNAITHGSSLVAFFLSRWTVFSQTFWNKSGEYQIVPTTIALTAARITAQ